MSASRKLHAFLFAVLFGMAANWAHAQSLTFGASPTQVGAGARALGKGNAFIAVADDATAASWNPAGLAQLERPEISLAWEFIDGSSDLDLTGHPEASTTRGTSLSDLNYLSLAVPLEVGRHMVVSLNYFRQFRFDGELYWHFVDPNGFNPFPPFTPVNVDTDEWYDQEGGFSSLTPALGIDVTDRLSLGVALNIWNDDITGESSFENTARVHSEHPILGAADSLSVSESVVDRGYSLVLGGLYRLSTEWTFGAVVKPAYNLHLGRTTKVGAATFKNDDILHVPWEVGAGVAWRPSEKWTVSSDVTWTQWSRYELESGSWGNSTRNPVNGLEIEDGRCNDAIGCRVGAEYLVVGDDWVVPLRCGLGYDPAPAVDDVDDYYTASVGAGFQRGRFMLDIGYELRWGPEVSGKGIGQVYQDTEEEVLRHRVVVSLIVYL